MTAAGIPDVLIGLGGGGSNITYRFLSQEWILESVIGLNTESGDSLNSLAVGTVDSTPQAGLHRERAEEVQERIGRIEEVTGQPGAGALRFTQPTLLTEFIPDDWLKPEGLEDDELVESLCEAEGLNNWWVSPESQVVQEVLDTEFENGVVRNRSLGKALYHLWKYENGLDSIDPSTQNSRVAVVTALGGGTGSGMLLDYATDIASDDIHLYAVLPGPEAPAVEKENTFAALSELEYAYQAGESPFRTITLLPHLSEAADSTFELAAVRTLLAHQAMMSTSRKTPGDLPGAGANRIHHGQFAPFTIAAPETIDVPFSRQEHALDVLQEIIDLRHGWLEVEADCCSIVEEYLYDQFSDIASEVLDEGTLDNTQSGHNLETTETLRKRLESDIGELLDLDAFAFTPFYSEIQHLRTIVDGELVSSKEQTATAGDESNVDMGEFLDLALNYLPAALPDPAAVEDYHPLYLTFLETIQEELEHIARVRELSVAIGSITTENTELSAEQADDIRRLLDAVMMGADRSTLFERTRDIERRQNDLASQVQELRDRQQDLEDYYERAQVITTERLELWLDSVSEDLDRLASLNEIEADLLEGVSQLQDEIERAMYELESADSIGEAESVGLDLGQYQWIARELAEHGIASLDLNHIEDSFYHVREAKIAELEYHAGLFTRFFGSDYEESYRDHREAVTGGQWFDIEPPEASDDRSFSCTFNFGKLPSEKDAASYRTYLVDTIVEEFETEYLSLRLEDEIERAVPRQRFDMFTDNLGGTVLGNLKTELSESRAESVPDLEQIIRPETPPRIEESDPATTTNGPPLVNPYRSYLNPISDQYQTLTDELSHQERTFQIFDHLPEPAPRLSDIREKYTAALKEAKTEFTTDVSAGDERYTTRFDVGFEAYHPADDLGDAGFLADNTHRVAAHFNNVIGIIGAGSDRAPIEEFSPTTDWNDDDLNSSDYKQSVSTVSFSRAFGQDTTPPEIPTWIKQALENAGLVQPGDSTEHEMFHMGGPDEITMVLFISDVFLDNLSNMAARYGYWDAYKEHQAKSESAISRHALGVGGRWDVWETIGEWATNMDVNPYQSAADGAFVYRETIGNVQDQDFITELLRARQDSEDAERNLFLDMLAFEPLERTVEFG